LIVKRKVQSTLPIRRLQPLKPKELVKKIKKENSKKYEGNFFNLTEVRTQSKNKIAKLKKNKQYSNYNKTYDEQGYKEQTIENIGIKSTDYYKKYLANREKSIKLNTKQILERNYLKSMKVKRDENEQAKSFKRIKARLQQLLVKRSPSTLESNLDNAFNKMDYNATQVAGHIKYNYSLSH